LIDIPRQIAQILSFWEGSTGCTYVTGWPFDRSDFLWYFEWSVIPTRCCCPGQTRVRGQRSELFNGFSDRENLQQLRDLIMSTAERNGVIIDQVVKLTDRDEVLVLWHVPDRRVRFRGTAPVIRAAPVSSESTKQGVEA